ncbi:MAG TPA: 1-phosphofructokinase family hexose kinase [Aquabacterium sp.]|uniref:1-phosphofructokinase family hexose kinase n=1 Tax=Aquabacterium sp. TaxID=1872578 RepID=UPI002E3128A5|nr:1-phosphofructokinase family hexose kinase [Aquabacterium sp.]HEX5358093.1 1-phosphofructokinase family hexose kinase [Aquabacterium sp.]
MTNILTLTMNPAVDVFTSIDRVIPGHKLRCEPAQTHPGGGGINVARVLHRLGADVRALYTCGGVTGRILQALLAQEQIPAQAINIANETRESFTVHEGASGQDFRFVLPGPALSEAEWQACLAALSQPQPAKYVIASGSLPPGVPDDVYARMATQARAQGSLFVLDTSGAALSAALQAGIHLVKPSLRELRDLTGLPLVSESDWCAAARGLILQGQAHMVALSLGEDGALLVTAEQAWRAHALKVDVASTIGAGDSFLAGLVWALDQQHDLAQALRHAMAAGAAALLTSGTALSQPADIQRLLGDVQIQAL